MTSHTQNNVWQGSAKLPEYRNRIELRLRHVNQLFNSLDPAPFYEQDLDTDAEEFIVGWARHVATARDFPLRLVAHRRSQTALSKFECGRVHVGRRRQRLDVHWPSVIRHWASELQHGEFRL